MGVYKKEQGGEVVKRMTHDSNLIKRENSGSIRRSKRVDDIVTSSRYVYLKVASGYNSHPSGNLRAFGSKL